MSIDYRPRLSIEITEEQNRKLKQLIPWGVKNQLFQVIVDDVIELIEKNGEIVIAAMLARKLRTSSLPSFRRITKDED